MFIPVDNSLFFNHCHIWYKVPQRKETIEGSSVLYKSTFKIWHMMGLYFANKDLRKVLDFVSYLFLLF